MMSISWDSKGSPDQETAYRLVLFIVGGEMNSQIAQKNLTEICEKELNDQCEVEIIDVLESFELAAEYKILVTPALVIVKPEPRVTVFGNLNDRSKLRAALRLKRGNHA